MHSPTPTPVCSSTVLGEQLQAAWSGSKANVDTAGLCHKDLGVRAVRRATLADPGAPGMPGPQKRTLLHRNHTCAAAGTLKCLGCKRTMPGRADAATGPPLCADCAAEEGTAARVWLVGPSACMHSPRLC